MKYPLSTVRLQKLQCVHKNEKASNTLHEQEISPLQGRTKSKDHFHSEMSQVQAVSETGLSLFQAT